MNLSKRFKKYRLLDPIAITISLWLFVIIGNYAFDFYPLQLDFLGVLCTAIFCFVGGMFVYRMLGTISFFKGNHAKELRSPNAFSSKNIQGSLHPT